jgi:hypothetical protein
MTSLLNYWTGYVLLQSTLAMNRIYDMASAPKILQSGFSKNQLINNGSLLLHRFYGFKARVKSPSYFSDRQQWDVENLL